MLRKFIIYLFIIVCTISMLYAICGFIVDIADVKNQTFASFFKLIKAEEIVNSAMGAFLGFGASILVEAIVLSRRKKKSIKNVIAELESILGGLQKDIYDEFFYGIDNPDVSMINDWSKPINKIKGLEYVIYLPIWNAVLQTGDVLEFKNEKYFEDLVWVYANLNKLQMLIDNFGDEDNPKKAERIFKLYLNIHKALNDESCKEYCRSLKSAFPQI